MLWEDARISASEIRVIQLKASKVWLSFPCISLLQSHTKVIINASCRFLVRCSDCRFLVQFSPLALVFQRQGSSFQLSMTMILVLEQFQNTLPFRADPFFTDTMQVSIYNDIPISLCGSNFWCKSTNFFYYVTILGYTHIVMRVSLLMQVNGFFYYVTIHGYTHIMMRVNFVMQVNGFLFYYVTIHGYNHIVMRVNFLMQVNCFFLLRHNSWVYPYCDASRFFDASQLIFLLCHHSWIYPYHDSSQFSDASRRIFYCITIHRYTHIVMRVSFLMQVKRFFLSRQHSWIYPYHDAG